MPLRIHPSSGAIQWLATGAAMGVVAGVTLGLYEMIVAGLTGPGFLAPVIAAASLVDGPDALAAAEQAEVIRRGLMVHAALSAGWGAFFGLLGALVPVLRMSRLGVFLVGPLFGALVWAVHFQLAVPLLFPWFPTSPGGMGLTGHVALFGAVLGALVARRMDRYSLRAELGQPSRAS